MQFLYFYIKVVITIDGTSVLSTLGTVAEFILDAFSGMADTLLQTPLFLIGIGFFVVGGTIGLVKRIIS